jgi:hypothetical protein
MLKEPMLQVTAHVVTATSKSSIVDIQYDTTRNSHLYVRHCLPNCVPRDVEFPREKLQDSRCAFRFSQRRV